MRGRGVMEVKGTAVKNQWLIFPRAAQTRRPSLGLDISRKVTGTLGPRDDGGVRGEVMGCVLTRVGQAALSSPACTALSVGYSVLRITRGRESVLNE